MRNLNITLNVTRENGETEELNVTERFESRFDDKIFNLIKTQTKSAGRGVVNFATVEKETSNINELAKRYNRINNESGEGFIPYETLMKSGDYKETIETITFR